MFMYYLHPVLSHGLAGTFQGVCMTVPLHRAELVVIGLYLHIQGFCFNGSRLQHRFHIYNVKQSCLYELTGITAFSHSSTDHHGIYSIHGWGRILPSPWDIGLQYPWLGPYRTDHPGVKYRWLGSPWKGSRFPR